MNIYLIDIKDNFKYVSFKQNSFIFDAKSKFITKYRLFFNHNEIKMINIIKSIAESKNSKNLIIFQKNNKYCDFQSSFNLNPKYIDLKFQSLYNKYLKLLLFI